LCLCGEKKAVKKNIVGEEHQQWQKLENKHRTNRIINKNFASLFLCVKQKCGEKILLVKNTNNGEKSKTI
jgi:hypothetical protein